MRKYQQLTLFERRVLFMLRKRGSSVGTIADHLGRHRSTLYRELSRNTDLRQFYSPNAAQTMALQRCQRDSQKQRDPKLKSYVDRGLARGWSPEQIAGRMYHLDLPYRACTETIYQLVYSASGIRRNWPRRLPLAKPKRGAIGARKRARYLKFRSISERSSAANQRREFGHWEGDSVQFTNSRNRHHITTLVERKTRYSQAILQHETVSESVMTRIKQRFSELPERACRTLTLDQGTEFSFYQILERISGRPKRSIVTYFCDVKSPWQKGTNENFNRRLRRYLPRNHNIQQLSEQKLENIIKMMNSTPRKCLGFQTPIEAYNHACRTSH